MTEGKTPIHEGHQPRNNERGYQPTKPAEIPTGDPNPQGGYQPTNTGDNPNNQPTPPGDE